MEIDRQTDRLIDRGGKRERERERERERRGTGPGENSTCDSCNLCFQFKSGVKDIHMGGQCALLKVNASRVYDYCAREASQIFGGSSIVREGRGKLVEQVYFRELQQGR